MARTKPSSSYTGNRTDFESQSSTTKSWLLIMRLSILNNILKCSTLFFLQVMFSQSITKEKLTTEDYGKWSTLIHENLSPNGKWITYKLRYDSGIDTLFVRHTATSKQYYFPKGNNAAFSNDDQWLTVNRENIVLLHNLITGEQKNIDSA